MDRFTEAATVPFRSLHMGRPHSPEESRAVARLQTRLKDLQLFSILLPAKLMVHRGGSNAPPSFFGPFEFGQESVLGGNPHFGRMTDLAVRRFQEQADIEVDGKAGMNTLFELQIRLDAINRARGQSVVGGIGSAVVEAVRSAARTGQPSATAGVVAGAIAAALAGENVTSNP